MNNNSKTIILFYFLVIYVILQFTWWWYLLLQLNIEIADIKKITFGTADEIYSNNLNKKIWMFFGEGAVFLILLTAGVWQVRKSFYKEASLAGQQKNFLLSITHELKTPVASAKLQLQTLLFRTLEKDKQNQLLQNTLKDLDRLDSLTEKVLLAAQIENKSIFAEPKTINFSEFLEQTISKNNSTANSIPFVNINYKIAPNIYILADESALYSIVMNIIDNGIKYSAANSEIEIQLTKNNNEALLEIKDNGIGITDSEKEKIFSKFYRIGNEETRNSKGTGLGLYIVKNLVKMYDGKIEIKNNLPQGSNFCISFNAV